MKKTLAFVCIALSLLVLCAVCAGALRLEQAESAAEEWGIPSESLSVTLSADGTSVYLAADAVYSGVPEDASVDVGKTEAVYDAAAGTVTGSGYAGPVTITAADGTVTTVVFCAPTKWKPGLNLLTGTEKAFGMDSTEAIDLTFSTSKTGAQRGTIEQANFPANTTNNALKLTGGAAVTVYTKNSFEGIEKARPVQVSFDYSRSGTYPFFTLANATTGSQYKSVSLRSTANPDSLVWTSIGAGTSTTSNCPSVITSLAIQAQHSAATHVTYLDNIEYIPYYKITYHLPDGTASSEYVLYKSGTTRMTEYTVKADNYPLTSGKICLGWTTEEGSLDPVSAVPLDNEDVDLYPVWKDSNLIDSDPVYMDASASHTLTVLNTEADIHWTVDVGESEAVFDEETLTLTGAGYAGMITVTATADGANETKYIYLCAPTKWKPGLNFLTGTTAPFDMESEEAINLSFTTQTTNAGVRGEFSRDNDPVSSTSSNHVINLTRAGTNATTLYNAKPLAVAIEATRPVHVEYEYYFTDRTTKDFYVLLNYTSNTIYKQLTGVAKPSSLTKKTINDGKNSNAITGMAIQAGPSGTTYLDNLAYIPSYKITYIGLDGTTVAATDYVLYDAAGKLLSSYSIPEDKVPDATGYYLDAALTEKVTVVALEHKDITLYAGNKREVCYRVGTEETLSLLSAEGESYTIPMPSEISESFSDTNFVAWVDQNGEVYHAHSVVTPDDVTDKLKGAVLTAFCQDASVPAMGFAFEGTSYTGSMQNCRYFETMEDDGRSVFHVHSALLFNKSSNKWAYDARAMMKIDKPFSSEEYPIVQYAYKINEAKSVPSEHATNKEYDPSTDGPLTDTTPKYKLWYYAENGKGGYNFYDTPSGENLITGTAIATAVDGLYHIDEFDMRTTASNSKCTYLGSATIGGFAIDPCTVDGRGDTYIDYIRAYRAGVTTVTYDTNVPAEAADFAVEIVHKEVEPDTGRGLGTGYLLKDDRPVIDDYVFCGWALTPDATADEVVDTVDLTGDLTVYAVWEYEYLTLPDDAEDTVNIRSGKDGVNGIRFRATIDPDAKKFVDEYGFIIARKDVLEEKGAELTFAFKEDMENKPLYVYGAAYIKGEKDLQYSIDDDGVVTFTAVCVGVPAAHITTPLVARPYTKYSGKNGLSFTVYGAGKTASIAEIAKSIKDAGGDAYEANKEYIDSVLAS